MTQNKTASELANLARKIGETKSAEVIKDYLKKNTLTRDDIFAPIEDVNPSRKDLIDYSTCLLQRSGTNKEAYGFLLTYAEEKGYKLQFSDITAQYTSPSRPSNASGDTYKAGNLNRNGEYLAGSPEIAPQIISLLEKNGKFLSRTDLENSTGESIVSPLSRFIQSGCAKEIFSHLAKGGHSVVGALKVNFGYRNRSERNAAPGALGSYISEVIRSDQLKEVKKVCEKNGEKITLFDVPTTWSNFDNAKNVENLLGVKGFSDDPAIVKSFFDNVSSLSSESRAVVRQFLDNPKMFVINRYKKEGAAKKAAATKPAKPLVKAVKSQER